MEMMNELLPSDDIMTDDEDWMIQLKTALDSLNPADKIIMLMYIQCGSLRDVANELNVSHTIIYKQIRKIKKQMYDYIKINYIGNNSVLLDRFKRCCNFI